MTIRSKRSFYTDSWSSIKEIGDISFASGYGWGDRETLSVVSNGEGYAIAWHSSEISSQSAVFANIYDGNSWSGATNLSLLGDVNGYQAIWTQAEQDGDPKVRIPWAMSGL